ncbi:MAG: hypothetical protein E6K81_09705 [Candidatus Eisenbacteria bacterium]|uniref:T9SS type A sorting domain-containing protein n=1 Tax=Eiseniibacteriota bacterium TaxID=2212470 RepID=A0A538U6U6_UNCEI|nr:MAG: hypothetical protein E6K81_09705 [Candidatus Eisenbacteria bacterium]
MTAPAVPPAATTSIFTRTCNEVLSERPNSNGGRDHLRLAVYDVRGKEVALLVNDVLAPGTYERELNGNTLATGVYGSRLQAGALSETRKIMHVR